MSSDFRAAETWEQSLFFYLPMAFQGSPTVLFLETPLFPAIYKVPQLSSYLTLELVQDVMRPSRASLTASRASMFFGRPANISLTLYLRPYRKLTIAKLRLDWLYEKLTVSELRLSRPRFH